MLDGLALGGWVLALCILDSPSVGTAQVVLLIITMLSVCYCLHVCMSARRFLSSYSALLSPCRLQDASCFAHEPGALPGSEGGWHVCPPLSIYSRCHPCALTLPCPPCMFVWGPLSCLCGISPITPFPLVHRLCLSGGLSWVVHLRYALHVPVSILHLCNYPNPNPNPAVHLSLPRPSPCSPSKRQSHHLKASSAGALCLVFLDTSGLYHHIYQLARPVACHQQGREG